MSHRIIYGGGAQQVRTVPLREGRAVLVASADFAILDTRYSDDSASHTVTSGAASVDSVSTTLAAAAGRNTSDPRSLTVASATGIVAGRRYLISSGGRSEIIKVEAVDGTTLRLAATLPVSFPSGAALRGVELVAEVPEATAAEDDYLGRAVLLVRWEPLGLQPYTEQVFVERSAPGPAITPEALLELDPTLASIAGGGLTAAGALAMALDDWTVDLLSRGIDDGELLAGPIGRSAVRYRAAHHLIKHLSDPTAVERSAAYAARYSELLASVVAGMTKPKVTHTRAEDGTAKPPTVRSLFRAGGW